MTVGLLSVSVAFAAPGEHIQAGDTVITPGVAAGAEYSNNPLHAAEVGPGSAAVDLTVAPRIDLKLTRDTLDFDLGANYQLRKYFGSQQDLDRYDDFMAHAKLDALKRSVIGLRLGEDAGLINAPMEVESVHPYASEFSSSSEAELAVRPGYSLEITAGGAFDFDSYATADTTDQNGSSHFNSRFTYGPTAGVMWKFLPRTAAILDFSYMHSTYELPSVTLEGFGSTDFSTHNILRIEGGLRGRITNRLVLTAVAGYGSAAFDDGGSTSDPSNDLGGNPGGGTATVGEALQHVLADVSVRYNLTDSTALTVGVEKDFRDSFFTNYVSYVKGYGSLDARFGEHFGTVLGADVSSEAYRGSEQRDDIVIGVRGDVNYYIREWIWLNLGGGWSRRISDQAHAAVQYDEFAGHVKLNIAY